MRKQMSGAPRQTYTISSNDVVVAEQDGSIAVNISREIRPGNWLRPNGDDEFVIVLRLYNPVSNLGAAGLRENLPSIVRTGCR